MTNDKQSEQPRQKRRLPNLWAFVDPEPPEGYKRDYRFIERRDFKKNIAITKSLNERLGVLAARYRLSQNSLINAILNRFCDEIDRVDKANGDYIPPKETQIRGKENED